MWHRRRADGDDPYTPVAEVQAAVVAEARAVIEGRVVDKLWAQGRPIPRWAWLNALAHRPAGEVGDLIGVACDQPGDGWADALVDIALDLSQTSETEAAKIQAELFVPAELTALAEKTPPDDPSQLVRAVRRRLANDGHWRPPHTQDSPHDPKT
jgi:hypothetical protein